MPTDKKFTGQRLDATGLYYYNARYYDATIGRFLSPDTVVQSPANPQNLNRYSYCINNPLSCVDPTGKDYVFVCGSGGKPENWNQMKEALDIPKDERVFFVYEDASSPYLGGNGGHFIGGWEIQDQVASLDTILRYQNLTDIKLIGHSEGAAAIITVLDNLAKDDKYLGNTNVRNQLKAAVTIEAPTIMGTSLLVESWNNDRYNDLLDRLAQKGIGVQLLDVWNDASLVHSGIMPGWNTWNTYHYDSRSWWQRGLDWLFGTDGIDRFLGTTFGNYHNDPLTNQGVIDRIKASTSS